MSITPGNGARSLQRLAFLKYYNVQNVCFASLWKKKGHHTDNGEFST